MTNSIQKALSETERRRKLQIKYNEEHNIKPVTINRKIIEMENFINVTKIEAETKDKAPQTLFDKKKLRTLQESLKKQMLKAAADLEFEEAAKIRDQLKKIDEALLTFEGS
jgi:excinuclease ABC subunit B